MRLSTVLPVAVVVLASQARAAATIHGLLVARQIGADMLSSTPPECKRDCSDYASLADECMALAASEAVDCMCTSATLPAIDKCFDCLMGMLEEVGAGAATIAPFQDQLDTVTEQITSVCADADKPLDGSSSGGSSSGGSSSGGSGSGGSASDDDEASDTATAKGATQTGASDDDDKQGSDASTVLGGDDSGASARSLGLAALLASVVGSALAL